MNFERNKSGLLVPKQKILGFGRYEGKIFDKKGRLKEEFIDENLVVNQGLNDMLAVYLQGGAQKSSWFMGIFQGNYAPVPTDTAANWAANATECSNYTNATRPSWTPAAPAAQSITNSAAPATFTFNATVTIFGAALVSNNVIGGTTGTLFSEAAFQSPKAVESGDQLLLTYSFTAASA